VNSPPSGRLRDDFAALVAARPADLAHGALMIARIGHPTLDPTPQLARLDALADAARPRLDGAASARERAVALAAHLFDEGGFRGNAREYYDPRNSFLSDVLARRTGIPITLAVVLIEVGARLGVRLEGVGFPGHFLVRVPDGRAPLLLDPFVGRPIDDRELLDRYRALGARGAAAVPPVALEATDTPGILTRMLRNLLRIYVDRDDHTHALETVDLVLVLHPDSADDVRLRGVLYQQLDCFAAAREDLRRYLALAPGAPDAERVRARIARLERKGPTLH
jgi:regulator of sirC expression with transglutaminase-like and TPR domain